MCKPNDLSVALCVALRIEKSLTISTLSRNDVFVWPRNMRDFSNRHSHCEAAKLPCPLVWSLGVLLVASRWLGCDVRQVKSAEKPQTLQVPT